MAFMGICNCYYKIKNKNAVALPGAISFGVDGGSELKTKRVFTDNGIIMEVPISVVQTAPRIGLNVFSLPKKFLTDILGYVVNEKGILEEYPQKLVQFSLLFESTNVEGGRVRYRYDNCYCSKPEFNVSTIADKTSLSTHKLNIISTAYPISQSIYEADNKTVFENWYNN